MKVDYGSIISKAADFLDSKEGKKLILKEAVIILKSGKTPKGASPTSIFTPEETAQIFIDVLRAEIASSGLSSNAINAISGNILYDPPIIADDGSYSIRVYFDNSSGQMTRPSLNGVEELKRLDELLNYGVDHTMKPVHGTWHGKEYWNRTKIPATDFMETAKDSFMRGYASKYGVKDIQIENDYH